MTESKMTRWAWAEIDLNAYSHNINVLKNMVSPSGLWAVVKANAYGHGAIQISHAALEAGVDGLCVAITSEGAALRKANIDAPVLLFSEQPLVEIPEIIEHQLIPTVYRIDYVDALAAHVRRIGGSPIAVHVKVDTGMHRVGVEPEGVPALLSRIAEHSEALQLGGIYTHFAAADVPDHPANALQAERFETVLRNVESLVGPLDPSVQVHALNSAGAMSLPAQRRSFVRAGIATYGIIPGDGVEGQCGDLRPVLSLRARVSRVQRLSAGEGVSYGHRFVTTRDTTIATLPIGYADGVPRRLWSTGGEVLIRGHRRRIVGVITMDQLMVDCGDDVIEVGDEAVFLGSQEGQWIRSEDWARALDTIGYEITCGIGPRIPRVYTRSV